MSLHSAKDRSVGDGRLESLGRQSTRRVHDPLALAHCIEVVETIVFWVMMVSSCFYRDCKKMVALGRVAMANARMARVAMAPHASADHWWTLH